MVRRVKNKILRIGMYPAFMAAMILTLPSCGSGPEEYWQQEQLVEEEVLEDVRYDETLSQGKLNLRVTQKTRVEETPVERKYLLFEESYSDFDWDQAGLVFFSILGGIISIGLYFLFAFYVFDETDEENK